MDLSNETHEHEHADAHEGAVTRTDGGKTLARGRDALQKIAGPRLSDFGVETGKALEPSRRGKKAAEPVVAAPAQDESELPMFRPGFNWFVLRVASNKEDSVRNTLLSSTPTCRNPHANARSHTKQNTAMASIVTMTTPVEFMISRRVDQFTLRISASVEIRKSTDFGLRPSSQNTSELRTAKNASATPAATYFAVSEPPAPSLDHTQ